VQTLCTYWQFHHLRTGLEGDGTSCCDKTPNTDTKLSGRQRKHAPNTDALLCVLQRTSVARILSRFNSRYFCLDSELLNLQEGVEHCPILPSQFTQLPPDTVAASRSCHYVSQMFYNARRVPYFVGRTNQRNAQINFLLINLLLFNYSDMFRLLNWSHPQGV